MEANDSTQEVWVWFDGPPDHIAPGFVDTHTAEGKGYGHPDVRWEEVESESGNPYWRLGPFRAPAM